MAWLEFTRRGTVELRLGGLGFGWLGLSGRGIVEFSGLGVDSLEGGGGLGFGNLEGGGGLGVGNLERGRLRIGRLGVRELLVARRCMSSPILPLMKLFLKSGLSKCAPFQNGVDNPPSRYHIKSAASSFGPSSFATSGPLLRSR